MKHSIIVFFCFSFLLLATSCHDDVKLADVENAIEYTVTCQNPEAQLHISATGLTASGIYCKEKFSNKCTTKDYFAVINVTCDDPKALIEVTLDVNGKNIGKYSGNRSVHVSERLKGSGPYLE